MVGVLRILRDPYLTSSHFALYWIGWLLCKTYHSLLILISLILVIFVFELLTPCTLPMYQGDPFLISIKLITYQKKKITAIWTHHSRNLLAEICPTIIQLGAFLLGSTKKIFNCMFSIICSFVFQVYLVIFQFTHRLIFNVLSELNDLLPLDLLFFLFFLNHVKTFISYLVCIACMLNHQKLTLSCHWIQYAAIQLSTTSLLEVQTAGDSLDVIFHLYSMSIP